MFKKYIRLIAAFGIVLGSLFYAFKNVSVPEILQAVNSVHYVYIVLAFLIIFVTYVLRAMRWTYLIASIKKVKTRDLLSPVLVGFMGNMLPARAGEFIRAYLLSKKENIRYSASLATIVIERLFDLIITLLLLLWILLFNSEIIAFGSKETNHLASYMVRFGWISFFACMLIFLFAIVLQYKNELAMKIVNFSVKPLPVKWADKVNRLVISFTEGLQIMKDKRGFWGTMLLTIIITVLVIFAYYLLYLAFDIKGIPMLTSLIILGLAVDIFGVVLPTPGFIGSFHAACVAALHGIFGIPKSVALSYGIVAWLVMIGLIVLTGAFIAVKEHISLGELSTCSKQAE